MKPILHTILASWILVFLAMPSAVAQTSRVELRAVSGQTLEIPISSSPQRPYLQVQPSHGLAYFTSTGSDLGTVDSDVLEYIPETSFFGTDTLTVQYWVTTPIPQPVQAQYIIEVGLSIVEAANDYAVTSIDVPVEIDVLANDEGSFGDLEVVEVTLVNGGSATTSGENVVFTPDAGYTGNASLSYSVCDLLGGCDVGGVTITVSDPNPKSDTLSIQVPREGAQVILLDLQGFPLSQAPAHGNVTSGETPIVYTPQAGYTGPDQVEWSMQIGGQQYTKVVYIDVLNVDPENQYARPDIVYTAEATPAFFNPRRNDHQGDLLVGFGIVERPKHGTAEVVDGNVVYTPAPNFSGADQLIYRVFPPNYSGSAEYATVDLIVSDLPPATAEFELKTPKNTPIVADYPIPFENYAFGIIEPLPSNGSAGYYPQLDSMIGGHQISGERLIVYNPAPGFVGEDVVRANYCITSTGNCLAFTIRVTVVDIDPPPGGWCVHDCVWPGDTDNNGIVEMADLLPIGECHGAVGLRRTDQSDDWRGLEAPSWVQPGMPADDLKYIDADGDGVISALDTVDLLDNLGRYHKPFPKSPSKFTNLPILIDLPFDTLYEGDLAYFDIILGTEQHYAENTYGFTYDLAFNKKLIREGSQRLSYDDNSWLTYNTASLSIKNESEFGVVNTAFTLTDGNARTGHGKVARFDFIVEEDLIGIRPGKSPESELGPQVIDYLDLELSNASVSNYGIRSKMSANKKSVPVARRPANAKVLDRDLIVMPNPASSSSSVLIHLNGVERIDAVEIYNDIGARMLSLTPDAQRVQLPTGSLPAGVYVVEARAKGQIVHQKLVIQ